MVMKVRTEGEILKRGYAFSHFSKFIRPGYVRVKTTDEDNLGLNITAYQGADEIVLILINNSDTAISDFQVSTGETAINSAVSYLTSIDINRDQSNISIEDGNAKVSIPGRSIRTIIIN